MDDIKVNSLEAEGHRGYAIRALSFENNRLSLGMHQRPAAAGILREKYEKTDDAFFYRAINL